MLNVLFLGLVCLSTGYSSIVGGRDGRLVSASFAAACLLSFPYVPSVLIGRYDRGWIDAHLALIDVLLVLGLWIVVMRSKSFWPIWVLGFQVAALAIDVLILSFSNTRPIVSYLLHAFWSIPQLIVMPVGIFLDQRGGMIQPGRPGAR